MSVYGFVFKIAISHALKLLFCAILFHGNHKLALLHQPHLILWSRLRVSVRFVVLHTSKRASLLATYRHCSRVHADSGRDNASVGPQTRCGLHCRQLHETLDTSIAQLKPELAAVEHQCHVVGDDNVQSLALVGLQPPYSLLILLTASWESWMLGTRIPSR